MDQIKFFDDKYYFFSNSSAHAVNYQGVLYPTAAHAYEAAKFKDPQIINEIKNAPSPYIVRMVAERYSTPEVLAEWEPNRLSVMEEIMRGKVMSHEDVKAALLATGDSELIYDNPEDPFWGGGADGMGANNIGKILMKIRQDYSFQD